MSPKELVKRFYHELWNRADESLAAEILDTDLHFRGSLGLERQGRDGFIDYMRSVHAALGGYTCVIEDLIVSDDSAAARMTFKGRHQGLFFGVEATGRNVAWEGTAYFRFASGRISKLWVESDLAGLKAQLDAGDAEPFALFGS
ncbi:MAG: ester cyclase [Hyphomicrobiales bacterium]|nr:ester cyclase [Hyphomicrobiales bacterium]